MLFLLIVTTLGALGAALLVAGVRQRTLQRDVESLRKQLDYANRQIERQNYLTSEIAHDIKNPLTAILCSAEALDLMLGKSLDPAHQRSLHFIHDYGDQVLRLLSDFLDTNRIQTGHIQSKRESFQVSRVCESVMGLLAALAEREQIQLSLVVLSALPPVMADPIHLKQILFNLIHNAIKYSGAGSEVSVILSWNVGDAGLMVEVADNGAGIPAERLPEIFNPYEHFDHPERGKRQHGLGLGLSLCRALVELEGGTLSVRSSEGKGASFSFVLPVDALALDDVGQFSIPEDHAADIESSRAVLDGRRILVVDPDEGVRVALSDLIGAWGAVVHSVQQAEDAVRALSEYEYDSILVDTFSTEEHLNKLMPSVQNNLPHRAPRIICAGDSAHPPAVQGVVSLEKPINSRELLGVLLSETIH